MNETNDKEMGMLVRSLFQEFQKTRGLTNKGFCPQCELEGVETPMFVNTGDLFECPTCHLQVSLATAGRATIIRSRGQGDIRSYDKKYCAIYNMNSMNLSREDPGTGVCQ